MLQCCPSARFERSCGAGLGDDEGGQEGGVDREERGENNNLETSLNKSRGPGAEGSDMVAVRPVAARNANTKPQQLGRHDHWLETLDDGVGPGQASCTGGGQQPHSTSPHPD